MRLSKPNLHKIVGISQVYYDINISIKDFLYKNIARGCDLPKIHEESIREMLTAFRARTMDIWMKIVNKPGLGQDTSNTPTAVKDAGAVRDESKHGIAKKDD